MLHFHMPIEITFLVFNPIYQDKLYALITGHSRQTSRSSAVNFICRVKYEFTLFAILVMNDLISRLVGQLFWQGASAHFRHLRNKITRLQKVQSNGDNILYIVIFLGTKSFLSSKHRVSGSHFLYTFSNV